MTAAQRLQRLVAVQRQINVLHAERYRLLAALDADPVTVSLPGAADKTGADRNWAVEDVACALRLSPAWRGGCWLRRVKRSGGPACSGCWRAGWSVPGICGRRVSRPWRWLMRWWRRCRTG